MNATLSTPQSKKPEPQQQQTPAPETAPQPQRQWLAIKPSWFNQKVGSAPDWD